MRLFFPMEHQRLNIIKDLDFIEILSKLENKRKILKKRNPAEF